MIKPALAVLVLSLSFAVARAEDGDEEATPSPSSTPAASAAAREKGYRTEEAKTATPPDVEEDSPMERHLESKTLVTAPPQRPLATAERRAAASGGAASSGVGISCEQSEPPLARVIHEDRPNLLRDTNKIERFAFGPNEAISYKFTAQKSGSGGFGTEESTNARREPTLITVSETPCDFDVKKALAGIDRGPTSPRGKWDACHIYNVGPGGTINMVPTGQALAPGANKDAICFVSPGKTYYFNIRSLSVDNVILTPTSVHDACAESAKTMGAGLKCGGIWQFIGAETDAAKKK